MLGEQTVANNIQTYPLGSASCICVSGNDVYVGGSVDNSITPSACYWKNNGAAVFMPRQGDYAEEMPFLFQAMMYIGRD